MNIWSEVGPCGSVGAHIKTGRSPMTQDHFKTPPEPKGGHGMTKHLEKKNKKSSGVGQGYMKGDAWGLGKSGMPLSD